MTTYIMGEVYYRLTYPDQKMRYPQIETFVFIGKRLSEEDINECWYFQYSTSYAKYGSVTATNQGDRKVVVLEKDELEEMLDSESLYRQLREAESRRQD